MRKTAILVAASLVLSLGANLSSTALAAMLTVALALGAGSTLAGAAGKHHQRLLQAPHRLELSEPRKVGNDPAIGGSVELEVRPRVRACMPERPVPPREREPIDEAGYLRLLEETSRIEPPEDRFEFLGYLKPANSDVWIHPDVEPAESLQDLLRERLLEFPRQDDDAARGILVSADGRVFVERESVYGLRLRALTSMPPEGQSSTRGTDYVGDGEVDPDPEDGEGRDVEAEPKDTIFGSDGRSLRTTSSYPWRAVGVSILRSSGGNWSRGAGSAAMIGPRAALTAAHVISPNGSSFNVLGVAPAARGYSWCSGSGSNNASTCKFPFGLRTVQWYYWPGQWEGGGAKYDYGVLILQDQNWSPGWIRFGYQSTSWLDWRNMNTAGYPAPGKSCSASPDSDGECGGYMYRQYENTRSVYTNVAYHKFDVQEGQSGAPIYNKSGSDRVVYLIHRGSNGTSAWAKRLRSGSFSTVCSWVKNWPSSFFSNVNC
jgi:V8-like Glu-specific endopeptidase